MKTGIKSSELQDSAGGNSCLCRWFRLWKNNNPQSCHRFSESWQRTGIGWWKWPDGTGSAQLPKADCRRSTTVHSLHRNSPREYHLWIWIHLRGTVMECHPCSQPGRSCPETAWWSGHDDHRTWGKSFRRTTAAHLHCPCILRNPKILILDEATSALDSISEKKIQDSIQKLVKGRTTLIVAHRLSTIRNADRIAVIGKGNVLECGAYEELIEKKGAFYRMEKM